MKQKYNDALKEIQNRDNLNNDNENDNIAVLAQNKARGFRKTNPASEAVPAPVTPINNIDSGDTKNKCDICSRAFKSPDRLRTHLEVTHGKVKGTMFECRICKFSALNKEHLKLHLQKSESHHKSVSIHKKNRTCRFWKNNTCNRSPCQFKHELINCKFGNNCYNQYCQYEHQRQGSINPWSNPAFLDQNSFQQNFPFLAQNHCMWQKRNMGK